ncbi:MAG: hypothetical protein ABIP42_04095, partial [Planctomycetota bacterium]
APALVIAIQPPGDVSFDCTVACDLDADGIRDCAVLTDARRPGSTITAWSLARGEVLRSARATDAANARVAWQSLCSLGDVTGDGAAEIVVGSHEFERGSWIVYGEWLECRDGRTGAVVWRQRPEEVTIGLPLLEIGGTYGGTYDSQSLTAVGDVDGDGAADFALVSANRSAARYVSGTWGICSGRTGRTLHGEAGPAPEELYGRLGSCRDLDGDGIQEVFTSPVENDDQLRSGKDGHVLRTLDLDGSAQDVGETPDFDGDGVPEIAVKSTRTNLLEQEHTRWLFVSSRTGKVARRTRSGPRGGYQDLRFVRDAATAELVMWTLTSTAIEARALKSERVLSSLELGRGIEGQLIEAGDIDGDGQCDLLIAMSSCGSKLFDAEPSSGAILMGNALRERLAALGGARAAYGGKGLMLGVVLPHGLSDR